MSTSCPVDDAGMPALTIGQVMAQREPKNLNEMTAEERDMRNALPPDFPITVTIPFSKLVPVESDHGGFLTHRCIVCRRGGWDYNWDHKPECAVGLVIFHEQELKKRGL